PHPVLDGLGAGPRLRGCRRHVVARGLPARHTAHDRTGGHTTGPLNAPEDYGRSPFPKPPQPASPRVPPIIRLMSSRPSSRDPVPHPGPRPLPTLVPF